MQLAVSAAGPCAGATPAEPKTAAVVRATAANLREANIEDSLPTISSITEPNGSGPPQHKNVTVRLHAPLLLRGESSSATGEAALDA
jgi:hypothetical protein